MSFALAASTSSLTNRVDVARESTSCGGTLEAGEERPCYLSSTSLGRTEVSASIELARSEETYRVGVCVVDREVGLSDGFAKLSVQANGCLEK